MNLSILCASKLVNKTAVCANHTCKAKVVWGKETYVLSKLIEIHE